LKSSLRRAHARQKIRVIHATKSRDLSTASADNRALNLRNFFLIACAQPLAYAMMGA